MRSTLRALPLLLAALVAASLALTSCGSSLATCGPSDDGSCLRILFIGNSYTYVNDLPGTLARLAQAGGHTIETDSLANGGATLADHLSDAETAARLDSRAWDFVVLQEQSQIPSIADSRDYSMFPAARSLVGEIERRGEKPIFFMTWAHRDGAPDYGMPDYETMQHAVDRAYYSIARELDVAVAPVGDTWLVVRRQDPDIALWQDDGSHPSTAGTYLAACVFYAAVFRQSPEGLGFDDGLAADTALILQRAAAQDVLATSAQ